MKIVFVWTFVSMFMHWFFSSSITAEICFNQKIIKTQNSLWLQNSYNNFTRKTSLVFWSVLCVQTVIETTSFLWTGGGVFVDVTMPSRIELFFVGLRWSVRWSVRLRLVSCISSGSHLDSHTCLISDFKAYDSRLDSYFKAYDLQLSQDFKTYDSWFDS